MKFLKTKTTHIAAILFLALTALSCSGSDDDNNDPDVPGGAQGSFFAKINSTDFNPEFKTGFYEEISDVYILTGSTGNGELIQLLIGAELGVGSYPLGEASGDNRVIAYYQISEGDADQVAAFATSGTVTLTKVDTDNSEIAGTFSFSGTILPSGEVYTVTEGAFSLDVSNL